MNDDAILEHDNYCMKLETIESNEKILKDLGSYCKNRGCETFIVSLSGGVDSMVIASVIKYLGYNIVCIHINYNNREASSHEAFFLKKWTTENGIELVYDNFTYMKRGEINRNYYENYTRDHRFKLYKRITDKYKNSSIILGHHDDDIIENVFNNVCRGRSILDLKVMKTECTMMNVAISRPLIGTRKKYIYDFAKKYNVPYFKDTTPLWSLRGKFRTILNPELEKAYSGFSTNILNISEQSDQWLNIITSHIIQPFMEKIEMKDNIVIIQFGEYKTSPE